MRKSIAILFVFAGAGIFGAPSPQPNSTGKTTVDLDSLFDEIFGSTSSSVAPLPTDKTTSSSDLDSLLEDVFGPKSTKASTISSTTSYPTSVEEEGKECTKGGVKGTCVPYYRCLDSDTEITESHSEELGITEESDCSHYLEVCCISTPTEINIYI